MSGCRWKPYSSSRQQCWREGQAASGGGIPAESDVTWREEVKREAEAERKRKREGRELRWRLIASGELAALSTGEADAQASARGETLIAPGNRSPGRETS